MSTIASLTTDVTINEQTTTIIAAAFTSSVTSMPLPYKLIASLDNDASSIASAVIGCETIDLDKLVANEPTLSQEYLKARFNEYGSDLVRYDNDKDMYYPRRTTPTAFVRRFVVPAIEDSITARVLTFAGIDTTHMIASHIASLAQTIAHTSVDRKVAHYTLGTSNADKASHRARKTKLSRKERKERAKAASC